MKLSPAQIDVMRELIKHELKESKSFYDKSDVVGVKRTLIEIYDRLEEAEKSKTIQKTRRSSK